jgi:hypothetical protein
MFITLLTAWCRSMSLDISDLKHALPESSSVSQETHTYYSSTPSSKDVKKKEEINLEVWI